MKRIERTADEAEVQLARNFPNAYEAVRPLAEAGYYEPRSVYRTALEVAQEAQRKGRSITRTQAVGEWYDERQAAAGPATDFDPESDETLAEVRRMRNSGQRLDVGAGTTARELEQDATMAELRKMRGQA
jgi:hypothetical protein